MKKCLTFVIGIIMVFSSLAKETPSYDLALVSPNQSEMKVEIHNYDLPLFKKDRRSWNPALVDYYFDWRPAAAGYTYPQLFMEIYSSYGDTQTWRATFRFKIQVYKNTCACFPPVYGWVNSYANYDVEVPPYQTYGVVRWYLADRRYVDADNAEYVSWQPM